MGWSVKLCEWECVCVRVPRESVLHGLYEQASKQGVRVTTVTMSFLVLVTWNSRAAIKMSCMMACWNLLMEANLGPLHTRTQEPWPWNCESPKESVPRLSQHISKIILVWSHDPQVYCEETISYVTGPQPNVISMNFLFTWVFIYD